MNVHDADEHTLHILVSRAGRAVDAGERSWAEVSERYKAAIPGLVLPDSPPEGKAYVALMMAYSSAVAEDAGLHLEASLDRVILIANAGGSGEEIGTVIRANTQESREAETAFTYACARRLLAMGEVFHNEPG